jgi:hypothetical protein
MQYHKRLIGYDSAKQLTPKQLEDFLESLVRQEIDGALIQEYLAGFGMKMIWRIVPATDEYLEELKEKGPGWL